LSSCVKLAHETKRQLLVWWIKDHRCGVPFSALFENYIEFVDSEFIDCITEGKLYVHSYNAVETTIQVTHNDHLQRLFFSLRHDSTAAMHLSLQHDKEKYVVVISDDFIGYTSDPEWIRSLKPTDKVKEKIDSLPVTVDMIGLHARGTDFYCPPQMYISMMIPYKDSLFYLATDDRDMEDEIKRVFNTRIITLSGKLYATKKDPGKDYKYNTLMIDEAMIYSVAELYLLAQTGILLGNERSSYFQIAKILHHANHN
jgi:hypothetical protein